MSYLLIAHNLATVRCLSHRVAVMYLGVIVEQATAEALFTSPLHPHQSPDLGGLNRSSRGLPGTHYSLWRGFLPQRTRRRVVASTPAARLPWRTAPQTCRCGNSPRAIPSRATCISAWVQGGSSGTANDVGVLYTGAAGSTSSCIRLHAYV